jgi:integrase
MSVKVRLRPGKGWYVLTDWSGQRKAKFFANNKALAKVFANKLAARLNWAEQNGEAITLGRKDGTIPAVTEYLTEWLRVYDDPHCKPSTAFGYRMVVNHHLIPALGSRRLNAVSRTDIKRLIAQWLT